MIKRIIAAVLIENDHVVRRVNQKTIAILGKPETTFKYLQNWDVDEICLINVGANNNFSTSVNTALNNCFIPVTVGGNISSLDDIDRLMGVGADKVVIGRHLSEKFINKIANKYGPQIVCGSIDKDHHKRCKEIQDWPIGEILMHDISRDGTGKGLNLDILKIKMRQSVIGMGGVGKYEDIVQAFDYCDSVCVGNLFHFKEMACRQAKNAAKKAGFRIR